MAECGARAAGEHRGGRALWCRSRRPADGVDATVDAVKAADLDPVGDGVTAQTQRAQLPSGGVAVLALGDPGYL